MARFAGPYRGDFDYPWSEEYPYQVAQLSEDNYVEYITDTLRDLDEFVGCDACDVTVYKRGELLFYGLEDHVIVWNDVTKEYEQEKS